MTAPGQNEPAGQAASTAYLLAEAGIPIIEIVNLEELAGEKVHEYVFFGASIILRGATGAPMRPIAMPLRN
ncbi:MAG TPA: hypothetical protein VGY52_13175 [Roseiarcus sp.]|jgi:hypothetical protein|nr:hypothetical protein [Roseiarcus sp.]